MAIALGGLLLGSPLLWRIAASDSQPAPDAPPTTPPPSPPAGPHRPPATPFSIDDDALGLRVVQRTLAVTDDEEGGPSVLLTTEAPCAEGGRCRELALLVHGRLRWHAPIDVSEAATVVGDRVVVATSSGVTARARASGSEQWHVPWADGGHDVPTLLTAVDGVVLLWPSGRLEVRDPEDGTRLAQMNIRDASVAWAGAPPTPWATPWGWYAFAHRQDSWTLLATRSGAPLPHALEGGDAGVLAMDAWVGDLHLMALVDANAFEHVPMPDARGFPLTLALAPQDGESPRTLLELGTGRWQTPTRSMSGHPWFAFRALPDGDFIALASDDGTAVLSRFGGAEHAVRWTRRIQVRSPLGAERGSTPVDLAVSARRIALALDGGRILTLLDAIHGTPTEFRADVVVR